MPTTKKTSDGSGQNIVQYVLVLLLIVAAFFIGYLWNKVQSTETSGGGGDVPVAKNPSVPAAPAFSIDDVLSKIGVDKGDFDSCMDSGYGKEQVEEDTKTATTAAVRGTPASFVLDTTSGKIARIPGALPIEQLTPIIDSLLSGDYEEEEKITLAEVTDNDHFSGDRNSRLVLVEYSDYDCPFCTRFHATAKAALEQYEGQLGWVYRHFPLDSLHPQARYKAEASECIAQIGGEEAFWNYSDELFQ